MMKLVLASNNLHKLQEIKVNLKANILITGLQEEGISEDIPETQNSIEGNARQKAVYIYKKYGINCIADDTGLEIDALDGRPGVFSARYAGEKCSFSDNVRKILSELEGINNRKARFRTIICLIIDGKEKLFEGVINGQITNEIKGENGFGYDPVFRPENSDLTFAEMTLDEKNAISHRGIAINKLAEYLQSIK